MEQPVTRKFVPWGTGCDHGELKVTNCAETANGWGLPRGGEAKLESGPSKQVQLQQRLLLDSSGRDLSFLLRLWKLQCAHHSIGVQQEWILRDVYSSTRVSWWCLAGASGARQQNQWVLVVMCALELQQHFLSPVPVPQAQRGSSQGRLPWHLQSSSTRVTFLYRVRSSNRCSMCFFFLLQREQECWCQEENSFWLIWGKRPFSASLSCCSFNVPRRGIMGTGMSLAWGKIYMLERK